MSPPNPQPPTPHPPPVFDDREITDVQPRIWADVLDMSKNVIYEKMFQKDPRFKIYIEKVLIAEVQDFVKAVTILIAAQYVFNVAYSKKLQSTYCFIQNYLLEIQNNSNCPTKVLNLMSKLKKSSLIRTWNNVLYLFISSKFFVKAIFC